MGREDEEGEHLTPNAEHRRKMSAKMSKTTLAMWAGRVYALRSFWENPQSLWHVCHN